MKKSIKILCFAAAFAATFLLGWRVMPWIWPGIKEAVVYPVLPQLRLSPEPTLEPYVPESSGDFGDPVDASDSLVYYFYKDNCYYCRMISPLMSGLPAQVVLPDGTISLVKLVCLNKNSEQFAGLIADYYASHGIEVENQTVPAVVIGEKYIVKSSVIVDELMDALISGEGLKTPLLDGNTRSE